MGAVLIQTNLALQNTQPLTPFTNTSQAQKSIINTNQTKFTSLLPENADTYAARRKNYLQRIQDTYKINITYFEQIIEALQNPEFAQLLLKHTLKETSWNQFFSINTSWGQYFAEKTELGIFLEAVQDCQKNQNECEALVPKKIAREANYQAQILLAEKSNLLTNQKVLEKPSYNNDNNEESPLQKIGPTFQVNTKELGFQTEPAIARFEDGSYVIIWKRNLNDVYSWRGRIFNPDGSPKTSEFLIAPSISDLSKPTVIPFENNNFAVGIETKNGTYVQYFNPDGIKADKSILLGTSCMYLRAESFNPRKAIFMWYAPAEKIVKGKVIYNNGSFSSEYALPIEEYDLKDKSIINLDNKDELIHVIDNKYKLIHVFDGPEETEKIYGITFRTTGKIIRSFIIADMIGASSDETITNLNDNELIAVLTDDTENVQGQKLRKDGIKIGTPFQISENTQKESLLTDAKIIKLSSERVFVAWIKIQLSLKKSDIFGQVMEEGEKIGPPIKINTNPNENALNYYMSPLNNTFILIWQGEIKPNKTNIYFQRFRINSSNKAKI